MYCSSSGLELTDSLDSLEAASYFLFEPGTQGGHDLCEQGLVVAGSYDESEHHSDTQPHFPLQAVPTLDSSAPELVT